MEPSKLESVRVFDHDIPDELVDGLLYEQFSVDTETDGLLYRRDQLRLVQLCYRDYQDKKHAILVRNPNHKSNNLCTVLSMAEVLIFHHAYFDLGFLAFRANIFFSPGLAPRIYCTKILSKIATPNESSSLDKVLAREFKLELPGKNKEICKSNWNAPQLSQEQIDYACIDIIYLDDLVDHFSGKMTPHQRHVHREAVDAVNHKVNLEVEGFTDLLQYESDPNTSTFRQEWQKQLVNFAKE